MDPGKLRQMSDEVSGLLASRLGAKGATLEARVASRARRLPRKVRRAAQTLIEAEAKVAVPKIARQIDAQAIGAAHATCVAYLRPLGFGARVWSFALNALTASVFALVVIVTLALIVSRARGLI